MTISQINVQNSDIERLQNAVIEKDQTGEWCHEFATNVPNANIEKLQNAVIKKSYFSNQFKQ